MILLFEANEAKSRVSSPCNCALSKSYGFTSSSSGRLSYKSLYWSWTRSKLAAILSNKTAASALVKLFVGGHGTVLTIVFFSLIALEIAAAIIKFIRW